MDWTDGYTSDIGYTTGFYREMMPRFVTLAALLQGQGAFDAARPFSYAELGCGQGFGTVLLAGACPHARVVGFDFNPGQVAHARGLAEAAGLDGVDIRDESFRQAADLPADALPTFDMIALHGIYTWVNRENRAAIVRFIDRWLKPGGLVYVSYNTLPGWAGMIPIQRLLMELTARDGAARSDQRLKTAMATIARLREAEPVFFKTYPAVGPRMDFFKDKDPGYLVHEFLHEGWEPLAVTDVARDMAAAKLTYVGSAALLENLEAMSLTKAAREAMTGITDPLLRELVKDHVINQQFRRDIYVKGARALPSAARQRVQADTMFVPLVTRDKMSFEFKTPLGKGNGDAAVYTPIADALADGPVTLREIISRSGIEVARAVTACTVLTASGQIHPVVPGAETRPARRLNRIVATRALEGEPYRFLAAPAIGSGVQAGDLDMAVFDALAADKRPLDKDIAALGRAVHGRFRAAGRTIAHEGKAVSDEADALAVLTPKIQAIVETRVPIWRMIGVL